MFFFLVYSRNELIETGLLLSLRNLLTAKTEFYRINCSVNANLRLSVQSRNHLFHLSHITCGFRTFQRRIKRESDTEKKEHTHKQTSRVEINHLNMSYSILLNCRFRCLRARVCAAFLQCYVAGGELSILHNSQMGII